MQYAALWLTLKKLLSPLSVRNYSVMLKIFHRHGKMHSCLLTWLHHMGIGPQWGCGTAGRQWCMFLYFCLLMLEEQLSDCDTLMSVFYKDNIVQIIAFNISAFIWGYGIIYSLYLSHSAFLAPLFTCASWGQDQAWDVKTSSSKFASL